ncbi:LOW QUALITY PROTEIN: hypothetical protein ACHAXA_003985 [Cyclostephanos tholiformis]|uniref:VDE lipocalin domain-containing protein n=1 Tax=Cyclostephanos tholiformis TaxID=382380 RepID=A0ABD3R4S6_9STRA
MLALNPDPERFVHTHSVSYGPPKNAMAPVAILNENRNGKRSREMMTASLSSSSSLCVARLAAFLVAVSTTANSRCGHSMAGPSLVNAAFVASPGVGGRIGIVASPVVQAKNLGVVGRDHDGVEEDDDDDDRPLRMRRLLLSPSLDDPDQKSKDRRQPLYDAFGFSAFFLTNPLLPHLPYSTFSSAHAEDELYAKYGGRGLDASLVDRDCLVNKCATQAKACLRDDPDCRKGLTCTAKCLGDNSCITGCFARYGNPNLDGLLKCTIEDNDCIKVAILEGGGDAIGTEPRSPAPTVRNFDLASMEGTWYKVVGYNPNYDCYACQRNTFSSPEGGWWSEGGGLNSPSPASGGGLIGAVLGRMGADRLQVDVEFSMPRINLELDDGSPLPPSGVRESFNGQSGLQSVGYNAYSTHETMIFDSNVNGAAKDLMKLGRGGEERLYSRTAHSEGEMFGLKFWENWYIIGQNDPYQDEFKFIYYNGKTRQNTYDGAFVYSRTRTLSPSSMEKVYKIAKDAGMNPDQFCKIQNGCFEGSDDASSQRPLYVERKGLGSPTNPFRGILASTRVSEILGVESVAAESVIPNTISSSMSGTVAGGGNNKNINRPWWKEVGDYLEDPRRHFRLMDSLRTNMDWPEYIKARN